MAEYVRGNRIYSVAADVVEAEGNAWAHYVARSGAVRFVALGTSDGRERYLVKA